MPDFPRVSSQRQLTTQQPEVMRDEAAGRTKIAADALKVVQDVAIKWDNALTTSQLNAFKATKGVFLADVKSRAALDPDQNASDKYLKEIDNYSKNALKGMSERAKVEAGLELQTDLDMTRIQIGGIFQKKIIAQAQLNLTASLDGYQKELLSTANPADMRKNFAAAYTQIDRNVEDGIISPDDGARLKIKFDEDVREGIIDRDLYSNPEGFKNNVAAYEFKDAKEKSDKLAKADTLIKAEAAQRKWEVTQINTQGCIDASNALLSRSLDHATVVDMQKKGILDFETAAIFDAVVTKGKYKVPKSTPLDKPKYFVRLLDEAGDNKTKALEVLKNAAVAYGEGNLGENQYAYIINEAKSKFARQQRGEDIGDFVKSSAINGLKIWARSVNPTSAFTGDLLSRFVDKLQVGLDPIVASKEVVKEQINSDYPGTTLLNDVPNAVVSDGKDMSVVFNSPSEARATHVWSRDGKLVPVKGK